MKMPLTLFLLLTFSQSVVAGSDMAKKVCSEDISNHKNRIVLCALLEEMDKLKLTLGAEPVQINPLPSKNIACRTDSESAATRHSNLNTCEIVATNLCAALGFNKKIYHEVLTIPTNSDTHRINLLFCGM